MKIKKETFESGALAVNVIAKELAVATVTSGLAMFGSAMTAVGLGLDKKHPILGTMFLTLSAGIVSCMVMSNDDVQDAICGIAYDETEKLTNLIYGPSDEEEVTED